VSATPVTTLVHGRSLLALHRLREGVGRHLLLLHGLGESSPSAVPSRLQPWPGPIAALDLTGHGASTVPPGGGYTCELLMADVDAALAELGPCTILGRGLGGYVALLSAGARPDLVRGAVLADGPGLVGGGSRPSTPHISSVHPAEDGATPDPFALADLSRDVRPPDYAVEFVRQAVQWSGLEHPVAVSAIQRPEWVTAVAAEPSVLDVSVEDALAGYAED
jgi:pimeloyl-ACP methyl ester carboxylesterase